MTVEQFNTCVDLYADRVYRFILKNTRNSNDAQDIVQNAFEILWKNYQNVSFEKSRAYLFTVAYRNMIDGIRKNKKMVLVEEMNENLLSSNSSYSGVKEVLDKAVAKLPEIQRTVVLLRDYEGYSYEEIGEVMNLNESQVKVYIFRARKTLKEYLVNLENVI